eukprot:9484041-Pyramimonas_sp.AAC.1
MLHFCKRYLPHVDCDVVAFRVRNQIHCATGAAVPAVVNVRELHGKLEVDHGLPHHCCSSSQRCQSALRRTTVLEGPPPCRLAL